MKIVIAILLILLPILLIMTIRCLAKKKKSKVKAIWLSLAFILSLGVVVWFFTPYNINIPEYDDSSIRVNNGDTTIELDKNQSSRVIDIIENLSFKRYFFTGSIYNENDEKYYFMLIVLKENNEVVYVGMFHFAETPFIGGGLAYDGDMNRIINPESLISYIVPIVKNQSKVAGLVTEAVPGYVC